MKLRRIITIDKELDKEWARQAKDENRSKSAHIRELIKENKPKFKRLGSAKK